MELFLKEVIVYLVVFSNVLIWTFVILTLVTQIIIPMFTNYKFFWIFTYWEIKKKYKNKLDEKDRKTMEKELKDSLKHK